MPRFHCTVYDGISQPDLTGVELPNLETARLEAVRLAGSILREDAQRVARGEDWRIEVTDDAGVALFRITLSVDDAPAAANDEHVGLLSMIRTQRTGVPAPRT